MTGLTKLPAGTKLLCIKGFVYVASRDVEGAGRRLTQGNIYTKSNGPGKILKIAECDLGEPCFWGDGTEFFVAVEGQLTPSERLSAIKDVGAGYASAVYSVYATEPEGQFYRDLKAVLNEG